MNGTTNNARRRVHASASTPDCFNDKIHNAGPNRQTKSGGRSKNRAKLQGHVGQLVRRKGKNLSRMKLMCSKLGRLRVLDAVLFIGVAAKLVSVLYSRRNPRSKQPSMSAQPDVQESAHHSYEEVETQWLPKWAERWVEHKMPFNSPLLYRREDDDYSFGYDAYLDDDGFARRKKRKKTEMRFRGMFPRDSHFDHYKEQLVSNGYAVVDDVLYNADVNRKDTQWAFNISNFELNQPLSEEESEFYYPAFDFRNDDEELPRHYIGDDDRWDPYYTYDDDNIRGTLGLGMVEAEMDLFDMSEGDVCTTPAFYRTYKPNCNEMHAELGGYQFLIGEDIYSRRWKKHVSPGKTHLSKYLGHGYYRDAFLFKPLFVSDAGKDHPSTQWDKVVFKTMRHMFPSDGGVSEDDTIDYLGLGFDPDDKYTFVHYLEDMRKDAMVMELLTSSPRATDIYLHCAMSSVIEFAPTDIEEHVLPTTGRTPKSILRGAQRKGEQEGPINDHISPAEKLELALEMAKCLAAMHGFKDGPIAHVDMQIGQFFRGSDGFLKIVDFNRAEAILYNTKSEKYCKWTNGQPPDAVYRAPEEQIDAPLTEKIDVFSLGNIFYAILTGRGVWESVEYEERERRIIEGENLEIPDFYRNERASRLLVRVIEACWTYDPDQRPSIFEVVNFLEQAAGVTSPSSLAKQ